MAKDSLTRKKMFTLIDKWTNSDMSQKSFCIQHKIPYYVFHYWYKKYREHKTDPSDISSFVPIHFDSVGGTYAELVMPNGKRLLFHQPAEVNILVQLLQ